METHAHISHKASRIKGMVPGFGLILASMSDGAKILVVGEPDRHKGMDGYSTGWKTDRVMGDW